MPIQRVAITGGPGTGKTSLIHELEALGYPCSHEYSRHIIQESLKVGSDVVPWDNLDAFSHRVMEGRTRQFHEAEGDLHFFDRTIIDTIAYQKADALHVQEEWHRAALELRYDQTVFFTPPWEEIYATDEERKESLEKLYHLHRYLVDTYTEYGYRVMEVPKIGITERANWILEQLGR